MFKFSEEYINQILEGIFAGTITERDLPLQLYLDIGEYLKKGCTKGMAFHLVL